MNKKESLPISIQPVISYPRQAKVGKTYLMEIDIKQTGDLETWSYEEEEYPIYCQVDNTPLFKIKFNGEPVILLHRFGGNYGTAKFFLTATSAEMKGDINITLKNGWGVPLKSLRLQDISVIKGKIEETEIVDTLTLIERKELILQELEFDVETLKIIDLKTFTSKTVFVNKRGEISREEPVTAYYFEEELAEGIELKMMRIPAGEFWMGSPKDEKQNYDDEQPQHKVTIKQEFYMSQTPITRGQWKAVTKLPQVGKELKENPSKFKGDDNLPVENVDWDDAIEFCARLSQKTGKNYRLPSEAEWEYACRAINNPVDEQEELNPEEKKQKSWLENITGIFRGNQEQESLAESSKRYPPFSFGETITDKLANYNASETYEEEPKGEYRRKTTPVGQFYPNAFGLYDMHGNVWEWCADPWHDNYNKAPNDGSVWDENNNDNRYQNYLESIDTLLNDSRNKVVKGASWANNPRHCRSAYRDERDARGILNYRGFRVVCG